MPKRPQKFYADNEKAVMKTYGLIPTKASGAGWLEKEDGQNDQVIAQLKSTDKKSYTLKKEDLNKLEYNACVCRKIPVFIVQFLEDGSEYLILKKEDLIPIVNHLTLPKSSPDVNSEPLVNIETNSGTQPSKKTIKSGNKEKYFKSRSKELEVQYGNGKFGQKPCTSKSSSKK